MIPPRRLDGILRRDGFTLIEMVIVILIILILAGLTVAVVGRTVDGDRVRGGARQVQNYLAGARDRAIYAASRREDLGAIPPAVGVRFIPDPAMTADDLSRVVYRSMVFVQEVNPIATQLRTVAATGMPVHVTQLNDNANPLDNFPLRSVKQLINRGLINSRLESVNPISGAAVRTRVYYLPIYYDDDRSRRPHIVRFVDAPFSPPGPNRGSLGGPGNEWLEFGLLSATPPFASGSDGGRSVRFRVMPSVMPSEEPRLLPSGCVIDGNSCNVGGVASIANLLRADGSFDIMFNSRGVVDGPLAAQGQLHLVVADAEDVEKGFRVAYVPPPSPPGPPPGDPNGPGFAGAFLNPDGTPYKDRTGASPIMDSDSDGAPDERQGEVFIISVRTQTGSVYSSDLNPALQTSPGNPYLLADPFAFAEAGGQAR